MKKNKLVGTILGLWVFVIALLVGKVVYDDVKKVNNPASVDKSIPFNAVVGNIDEKNEKEEENKIDDKTQNKEALNNEKVDNEESKIDNEIALANPKDVNDNSEKVLVKEIYGTKIYDEITYTIKNGEKVKTSSKRIVDASNYNASLNDLVNEALILINNNESIYKEVLDYTNLYRNEVNVSKLTIDSKLNILATIRALEMAYSNNFSHTRLDGTNCTKLAKELGISFKVMGENIAYGYKNSLSVSKGWKNSKGHYANMINASYNKIGIGLFNFNGNIYWVQIFSD